MAKSTCSGKKCGSKPADASPNGGIVALTRELWQAADTLRGSIEPADYKRYVLPIIFLRFLSRRHQGPAGLGDGPSSASRRQILFGEGQGFDEPLEAAAG